MRNVYYRIAVLMLALLFLQAGPVEAQQLRLRRDQKPVSSAQSLQGGKTVEVRERNVRAHMEFLASDALQGRGSGTQYELIAGQYIASQLRQFGIAPAGETDSSGQRLFLQTVNMTRNSFADAPKLSFSSAGKTIEWAHSKEIYVFQMNTARASGPLQKMGVDGKPSAGAVLFIRLREGENLQSLFQRVPEFFKQGVAAVLIEETPALRQRWSTKPPAFTSTSGSNAEMRNIIAVSSEAARALEQVADGTQIEIKGRLNEAEAKNTWNVVGELRGSDPRLSQEVILISAHMDHLGVRPSAPGDNIYNGADDDASGVTAVLELARALGAGPRPKRTVYFVLFGSEEVGGHGAKYYIEHLPFKLEALAANLEFEMIGRPDAKVAPDTLWLTGYERSDLGPELAKHGARLVADPHPEERFFCRSDNYTLAVRGVVAHTVSSYGLHHEYHQPNDDLAHVDFAHMTKAINSMLEPVQWLVNAGFRPSWVAGKKPLGPSSDCEQAFNR
ncbi:MAG TPA: M20/M25/M40 family metallo-hydrolase [Pyrinomonadaceae bacterium]|jgi:hypothetical protein